MGKYSDALVVVTNGSDGTQNMIETAKELGLMVYIHKIEG
jgi:hypothetical protein